MTAKKANPPGPSSWTSAKITEELSYSAPIYSASVRLYLHGMFSLACYILRGLRIQTLLPWQLARGAHLSQTSVQKYSLFPPCLLRKIFESSELMGPMGIWGKGHTCRTAPVLTGGQGMLGQYRDGVEGALARRETQTLSGNQRNCCAALFNVGQFKSPNHAGPQNVGVQALHFLADGTPLQSHYGKHATCPRWKSKAVVLGK